MARCSSKGLGEMPLVVAALICLQAVYGVLKEAEHRSTFYIPYWNIPISKYVVPRQVKFHQGVESGAALEGCSTSRCAARMGWMLHVARSL